MFDEICANLLTLSKYRKRTKREKTSKKIIEKISYQIEKSLPYELTNDQKNLK